ncbi:Glyoxylase I 4 [Dionaea muscipula]
MKDNMMRGNPLHLTSLNHISVVCKSVEESIDFYQNVLGFVPVRRPGSFDFNGAWLFGYGIGIHLLQVDEPEKNLPKKDEINPKDNHISFQCESMGAVEKKLKDMAIKYVRQRVEEGGIYVDQLFFHDPDGFMIEICNCDDLPMIPLAGDNLVRSCSRVNLQMLQQQQQQLHQLVHQ